MFKHKLSVCKAATKPVPSTFSFTGPPFHPKTQLFHAHPVPNGLTVHEEDAFCSLPHITKSKYICGITVTRKGKIWNNYCNSFSSLFLFCFLVCCWLVFF